MDEVRNVIQQQAVVGSTWKNTGVLAIIFLLLALIVAAIMWVFHAKEEDFSGVWKSQDSSQVYVLDKIEGDKLDYRLTVAGHRLLVESVDSDATHHQISLTVRTDSGLKAIWTFSRANGSQDKASSLTLDQDGLASEILKYQRALTNTDKVRISHLKPNKKVLWSPAFSCEQAASDVERIICTNKEIAMLDVRVSKLIKVADNNTKNVQKTWLKEVRDGCVDVECLRSAYQTRLETLTFVPAVAEPVSEEADPMTAESQ